MNPFLIFFLVWLVIVIHMSLVWLIYRYLKNPSVVDVGWASGLVLSGLIFLYIEPVSLKSFILSLLLLSWGLRLGLYLWLTRIKKGHVDKRYQRLSEDWKMAKALGFFLNFQLQGVLILILATPWYFIGLSSLKAINWLDILGIILFIIALFGESLADYQLQQFKAHPDGKVCTRGLWQYSRHPNYFFEWLIWCAFSLFGLSHPYGWIGLISPLCLYLIMTRITAPMTEEGSIESRGQAYIDYQKNTRMFFPIPK